MSIQYFDFRSEALPYDTFDVSVCYSEKQKMELVFRVQSKLSNFLGDHGNKTDVSGKVDTLEELNGSLSNVYMIGFMIRYEFNFLRS